MKNVRIIGVDASLTSTAVCVFTPEQGMEVHAFMQKGKSRKWVSPMGGTIKAHQVDYRQSKTYAVSELLKLEDYQVAAKKIADTVDFREGDQVCIEGYAMRASGNMVDLVMFTSFLRMQIVARGAKLHVKSPMSIKTEFAALMYERDKKGIVRNKMGLAGGKFTKHEMLEAAALDSGWDDNFKQALKPIAKEMLGMKSIPSPINDCVDAYAACIILGENGLF